MAAVDNLSGQQFYHGTTAEFQPGDIIRPGAEVGVDNHPNLKSWRKQHVWLTHDPQGAHAYADLFHQNGPTNAYEVEPSEEPKRRRKLSKNDPGGAEYTTSSARVIGRRVPRIQQGHFQTGSDPVYSSGYSNDQHKYWEHPDRRNFR